MKLLPPIDQSTLFEIAKLCGKLDTGVQETTGSEINHMLLSADLPNPTPSETKWKRIYNAFAEFQNEHQTSNNICNFIRLVFNPSRFINHPNNFHKAVVPLNRLLSRCELEFREDGKLYHVSKAETITEAVLRAQRLKQQLELRNVHPTILKFAETEIASDNYFHTVLEAMKSISATLQKLSGYYDDGANLVNYTLLGDTPRFVINDYKTQSQKSEQKGFGNLLIGLYSTFRNPTAHEAKITWELSEEDALDVLCMISYVHRKLEKVRPR